MSQRAFVEAAIVLAWAAVSAERGGVIHGGGRPPSQVPAAGVQAPAHGPVVIRMRQVPVPHPQPIQNPGQLIHDRRQAVPPARGPSGAAIRSAPVRTPPAGHVTVTRDRAVMHDINAQQRVEVVPGRYYWHQGRTFRYVHHFDHQHVHWYGFYFGPSFYWCRWWYGRWWWFDPAVASWVFWHDGYWWWQPAAGPMYVYVDNNFYPYDEEAGAVTVTNPEVQPPAAAPPAGQGSVFKSPDGKRMVQISGDRREAFLYDNTGPEPTFMKYLARGVAKARFSGGSGGRPLRILLDFVGGDFAFFDADGRPLDGSEPAARGQELPAAPPSAPSAPPGNVTPSQ